GTVTGADGNTYEVTSITKGAVAGESSITTVVVGDGITAIGKGAFKNCDSLTKVAIGDDVTSILKDAFRGDSNLTRVYINSAALEKIGSYAFGGISKSAVIKVTGTKSQYSRTYDLIEKSHINASVKVKRHA
ncbi:MAG: leucine-rich repeat domain-containing protein, partial [Eubacterium sp.]|nr:leucine-rich repeat domain-containing protein [Eubacterium sp.]